MVNFSFRRQKQGTQSQYPVQANLPLIVVKNNNLRKSHIGGKSSQLHCSIGTPAKLQNSSAVSGMKTSVSS